MQFSPDLWMRLSNPGQQYPGQAPVPPANSQLFCKQHLLRQSGNWRADFLPQLTIHLHLWPSFLLFATGVFLPIKLKYCDRHQHKLTLNRTNKGKFHWGTRSVVFEHVESCKTQQRSEEDLLALPTPQQKQKTNKTPHLQCQQRNLRCLLHLQGKKNRQGVFRC